MIGDRMDEKKKIKVGIVDTMFSRVNMGEIAIDELNKYYPDAKYIRRTVPGIKDIAVECKRLFDEEKCDVCLALGMVGGAPVDQVCAHEASSAIMRVKLDTGKHIIEAFVHENEAWSEKELFDIMNNRVRKHVRNAVDILIHPERLVNNAGRGVRQGKEDEGPIDPNLTKKPKIAAVVASFNEEITERMLERAIDTIAENEAELGRVIKVFGTFEIPLAVKKLFYDKTNDGVVVLGAVIKGDTAHDEVIIKPVAPKVADLSLEFREPVGFGIIGHDASFEDADERAEEYAERAVNAVLKSLDELRK